MLSLILTLALVGCLVYLITTYIPMPAVFKTAIYVICAVVIIVYLMRVLGIADLPIPKVR